MTQDTFFSPAAETFFSPQLILPEINQRLRRVLDLAWGLLPANDPAVENLRQVLRQTTILQLLYGRHVVAVAGLQGVGKSTLIQELYDFSAKKTEDGQVSPEWIGGTTREDERIPVLVLETSGVSRPTPFVHAYRWGPDGSDGIERISLDSGEFRAIAQQPDQTRDEARVNILLELQVPRRYFHADDCGFLVLPGFHSKNAASARNDHGSRLAYYSLLAASTYLLVVDDVADYREIALQDEFEPWFAASEPLFVLPRCDVSPGLAAGRKADLMEKLKLSAEQSDRVICTGTDSAGFPKTNWIAAMRLALDAYAQPSSGARHAQMNQLLEMLDQLYEHDTLDSILRAAEKREVQHFPLRETLARLLEIYENAANARAKKLQRQLAGHLQAETGVFVDLIARELPRGWDSFWKELMNAMLNAGRPSDRDLKALEKKVRDRWNEHMNGFNRRMTANWALTPGQLKEPPRLPERAEDIPVENLRELKNALRDLPALAELALLRDDQTRTDILHARLPLPEMESRDENTLLGTVAMAASNFAPSPIREVSFVLSAFFNRLGTLLQRAAHYNDRALAAEYTQRLAEIEMQNLLDNYTRLADLLAEKVHEFLNRYLNLQQQQHDREQLHLQISRLKSSVAKMKEYANQQRGYLH